jgi:hypothetical protein
MLPRPGRGSVCPVPGLGAATDRVAVSALRPDQERPRRAFNLEEGLALGEGAPATVEGRPWYEAKRGRRSCLAAKTWVYLGLGLVSIVAWMIIAIPPLFEPSRVLIVCGNGSCTRFPAGELAWAELLTAIPFVIAAGAFFGYAVWVQRRVGYESVRCTHYLTFQPYRARRVRALASPRRTCSAVAEPAQPALGVRHAGRRSTLGGTCLSWVGGRNSPSDTPGSTGTLVLGWSGRVW